MLTQEQNELVNKIRESLSSQQSSATVHTIAYKLFLSLQRSGDAPPLSKMVGGLIGPERVGENDLERFDENFFRKPQRTEALLAWTIKSLPAIKLIKDIGHLPLEYRDDFVDFVSSKFVDFQSVIKKFPEGSVLQSNDKKAVKKVSYEISNAIQRYLEGHPADAYSHLSRCMKKLEPYVKDLLVTMKDRPIELYKMRIGDNHRFTRDEMLHIPFELRGLVKSNRYSIPGLPCVYLGSSPLMCWEELGRPDLDTIQTSLFIPGDEMIILDISLPPSSLIDYVYFMFRNYQGEQWMEKNVYRPLRSFIIMWPLIAACSIQVKHPEHPFKPEYIVPQLLLQWIRKSNYDGICYFSTKISSYDMHNVSIYRNYAIPVKTSQDSGYCLELKKKFNVITDSAPWQMFQFYKGTPNTNSAEGRLRIEVELIKNVKIYYKDTDFGKLETFLNKMSNSEDVVNSP